MFKCYCEWLNSERFQRIFLHNLKILLASPLKWLFFCTNPFSTTNGAIKSCLKDRIFELNEDECHQKVVITSGKFSLNLQFGVYQRENMKDAMDVVSVLMKNDI